MKELTKQEERDYLAKFVKTLAPGSYLYFIFVSSGLQQDIEHAITCDLGFVDSVTNLEQQLKQLREDVQKLEAKKAAVAGELIDRSKDLSWVTANLNATIKRAQELLEPVERYSTIINKLYVPAPRENPYSIVDEYTD